MRNLRKSKSKVSKSCANTSSGVPPNRINIHSDIHMYTQDSHEDKGAKASCVSPLPVA